ncbi:MAG: hypothetical protein AAB692_01280 [Patescibacteria group bacterium]
MGVSSDFRLRFWALLQFCRDVAVLRDLSDIGHCFRDELLATLPAGHLNKVHFVCLQDEFPDLTTGTPFSRLSPVNIGINGLKSLIRGDVKKTGVLHGYAAAELRHLLACEPCQKSVDDWIREDYGDHRYMRRIMSRAGIGKDAN